MSFGAPLVLFALIALPALALWYMRQQGRRRAQAAAFARPQLQRNVVPRRPGWRRHAPYVAMALALAVLIVAAARPQKTVAVPVEQASVMLVTDASGSMEATDVRPTRLTAAVDAAQKFLDKVPAATKVGLVAYSTAPHTAQAPTTDRDIVAATLDSLSADGGTATGDALASALQALGRDPNGTTPRKGRRPPAAIILLSDGKAMGGRDPDSVAKVAGREGVPIYTVALGTPDGVVASPFGDVIPVPPDPASLRRIARESGGRFFNVTDADRLSAVYESLGSQLGTRERKRENTALFAGIGLVLLLVGAGLAVRWRGRLT